MHKVIFGMPWDGGSSHPGYLYLRAEARKEGWAGTNGLKGMIEERYGKGARFYFRHGDLYGIGFKSVDDYNDFCYNAGVETQLKMF
jgi:hypothetical protein